MKKPADYYSCSYVIWYKERGKKRRVTLCDEYKFVSLKRLKEEIQWLKNLYGELGERRKVSFGPIFHCVATKIEA